MISSYIHTCKYLILSDLTCLKQTIVDRYIDVIVWLAITMINTNYIMPYFGLMSNFGAIQLGGIIAAVGLFELYSSTIELVSDYEGSCIINYSLTLPIPSWLAIASKAGFYFITYTLLTTLTLPIGMIFIAKQLNTEHINLGKLALAIIAQSIFYACFVLWTSSIIKNMGSMGKVWSRFIFPMWFMGGFNFSWLALHQTIPIFSYISLLNPMIYITESTRIGLLGQEGYLNFWLCVTAICMFAGFFGTWGMHNLKKRLDFI